MQNWLQSEGPLEVEIGCGKGKFLVSRAVLFPHVRFLGLDKAGKWMKIGQQKSEKRQLANIQFFKGEAKEFIEKDLLSSSVDIFHIYFPDPWPKRRHHKRRLITTKFLTLLHDRLKEGGLIEFATDEAEYFKEIKKSIIQTTLLWKKMIENDQRIFEPDLKTNYELKYATEGRPLYYLELRK